MWHDAAHIVPSSMQVSGVCVTIMLLGLLFSVCGYLGEHKWVLFEDSFSIKGSGDFQGIEAF